MWFSAQGAGRDGVTNMDVVRSALAEVGCVLVRRLREVVGSVVVVAEAVAEDVPDDVVRGWVAVDEYDEEDDSGCPKDHVSVRWVVVKLADEVEVRASWVDERKAVEENVAREVDAEVVGECGTVAVRLEAGEHVIDAVPVIVQPRARSEMVDAHGYPPEDERTHIEPFT